MCGFDKLTPDPSLINQTDFDDVGEKFKTVAKPLYDVAETILNDLVNRGDVELDETRNPRIVGIRYTYGKSFEIITREDIFIYETGEKSKFLQQERHISLENFGEYVNVFPAYEN